MEGREVAAAASTKPARTWSQITRLAREAIAALDAGKTKDVRAMLVAISGVAANADSEGV